MHARRWFTILILLLGALLTACGGSRAATATAYRPAAASAAPASAASRPAASAAPMPPAASPGAALNIPVAAQTPLLIKTGTLGLVVHDVDRIFDRLKVIARKHGGDVAHYTNNKAGEMRVADLTLVVESGRFEAAMQEIRDLKDEIIERKIDKAESQDVTEEYVDIESQVRNLQLTEQQLRAILEKATKTEDILAIQREITAVRGEIEKRQGRATYLERRAAMSTIAMHLETPPPPPSPSPTPAPTPALTPEPVASLGDTASGAWSASLRLLHFAATAVVTVAVFFWWVLPVALVSWPLVRLLRRPRRTPPPLVVPPDATSGD